MMTDPVTGKADVTGGRKFWITLAGILAASLRPEAAPAVAAMVMAFSGANAAISWAYSGRGTAPAVTVSGADRVEVTRPGRASTEPDLYRDDERG